MALIKPTLLLTATAFISALALSYVDKITAPAIAAQRAEKEKTAVEAVLPGYNVGEEKSADIDGNKFRYWIGEKNVSDSPSDDTGAAFEAEQAVAYAFICSNAGYSGDITLMTGVDSAGVLLGIYITEQSETPGLGARCMETASTDSFWDIFSASDKEKSETEPVPWFQQQFIGLRTNEKIGIEKIGDWTPDKSKQLLDKNVITAITGATITSRAVVSAIENGMLTLKQVLAESDETLKNEASE